MTTDQIKDIFEPVVKQVCELVQGQVDSLRAKGAIVSGIILVGGFGQSDYLYRRLKRHFSSVSTPSPPPPPPAYSEQPTQPQETTASRQGGSSIEVIQPVYAWTAVVRGAVLRGLEGSMVISRKARMHYGTSFATVYDQEKHTTGERYWSPLWERWIVSDRMQWHIAKVSFSPGLWITLCVMIANLYLPSFFLCRERHFHPPDPSPSITNAISDQASLSS
jgi:hypothetical protein